MLRPLQQRLYVKASKAAAGDEDPADAEKCQQATEQKLMLAILTGQLALADVTVPQQPSGKTSPLSYESDSPPQNVGSNSIKTFH